VNLAILLAAIMTVESGGEKYPDLAVGDNGTAIGAYQIRQDFLTDFNRITGAGWKLEEMKDRKKARFVAYKVLNHYGRAYTRRTGEKPSCEILARIYNGGYKDLFENRSKTDGYWFKVRLAIQQQGDEKWQE